MAQNISSTRLDYPTTQSRIQPASHTAHGAPIPAVPADEPLWTAQSGLHRGVVEGVAVRLSSGEAVGTLVGWRIGGVTGGNKSEGPAEDGYFRVAWASVDAAYVFCFNWSR